MPRESWFLNVCLLWVSSLEDRRKEMMFKLGVEVVREILEEMRLAVSLRAESQCDGGDSRKC